MAQLNFEVKVMGKCDAARDAAVYTALVPFVEFFRLTAEKI